MFVVICDSRPRKVRLPIEGQRKIGRNFQHTWYLGIHAILDVSAYKLVPPSMVVVRRMAQPMSYGCNQLLVQL